jgi:ABC-type glutathione transport system ATPase component
VGIAGESGAGKTTLALSLLGLLPGNMTMIDGRVLYDGRDVTTRGTDKGRARSAFLARQTGFIFQDPQTALNPLMSVGSQVEERLALCGMKSRKERREHTRAIFREVGLPDTDGFLKRYPHELSGGMQQRVVIAQAVVHRPPLVIADEPTASLDPGIRDDIAVLLETLTRERGSALLLISHDWTLLKRMCGDMHMMYNGEFVEHGPPEEILNHPRHPYTKALLAAMPSFEKRGQVL